LNAATGKRSNDLTKETMMGRFTAVLASVALFALVAAPTQAAEKAGAGQATAGQAHKGQGTIKAVDEKTGKINMAHGPIPSLNWPAMTMDLQVKDKAMLKGLAPGQNVEFDVVQEGPGQFVISRIAPAKGPAQSAPANSDPHKGHH
jgi:Cu/Ag efflux protein CusF